MKAPIFPGRDATIAALVAASLTEDVGPGDWTTEWTVSEGPGRALVVAKEPLVVAGTDPAMAVFQALDPEVLLDVVVGDGGTAAPGEPLLRVRGSRRSILTGERSALNFLGHLSGIATLTRRFVDRIAGTRARVIDTRKTTPGWRILEKEAVRVGGGANHRMGLHDMILIKDNHIAVAGGITAAVERVRRRDSVGLQVEVEVATLEQLDEVLGLHVDRILLDNMPVSRLSEAVSRVASFDGPRPELEASGNVTLDTVRAVAETGVDFVSVGALTHSAPSADLSLRMELP